MSNILDEKYIRELIKKEVEQKLSEIRDKQPITGEDE